MSDVIAGQIAPRLDRLTPPGRVWVIIVLISIGGMFEFYELFATGYIAPSMVRDGLFSASSLGVFAGLKAVAVSGAGTFVFSAFMGLWVGAVAFAGLADRFGRKKVFLSSIVWYLGCSGVMALQTSGQMLNMWRLLAGIGFGVQLVTMDVYIAELMPATHRARAFALNQFITFSIVPVVALLAWLLVPYKPGGLDGWRWVILLGSVGFFVVWVLDIYIPESPRWLAVQGRVAEADEIVRMLEIAARAAPFNPPVMEPRRGREQPWREQPGRGRFWEVFSSRYVERTIMLVIFNMAQVIGFYGFAAWVPTLLIARGVTTTSSLEYSFIIASANPVGPLIAMLISDKVELKYQLVGGLVLMGVFMTGFSVQSDPVWLILLGVLFTLAANLMSYAYHAYQAELYPTRIRARAVGFVYSFSRISAAFSALMVGYFMTNGGVPAIAVFTGVAMLISMVIISVFGPDTRKRPLEEINH